MDQRLLNDAQVRFCAAKKKTMASGERLAIEAD